MLHSYNINIFSYYHCFLKLETYFILNHDQEIELISEFPIAESRTTIVSMKSSAQGLGTVFTHSDLSVPQCPNCTILSTCNSAVLSEHISGIIITQI
jgi:hypothetical protein